MEVFDSTFYAYVPPDVSTYYNETDGTRKVQTMKHNGFFGKFINLSPEPVRVHWDGGRSSGLVYISSVPPFSSAGTATYPTHKFVVTPENDSTIILHKWTIQAGNSLYYYDPFNFDYAKAQKALTEQQLLLYHLQWQNKQFAEAYKKFTGTDWLALYGQKLAPRFHQWRADFIGQTHSITTNQIHFVEKPDPEILQRGTSVYGPRPDEVANVRPHRHKYAELNLTLTVLSCAPRVFEVPNFLSDVEVAHILEIAGAADMQRSGVRASEGSDVATSNTRTSTNTWVSRKTDIIIDAIYQRAAAVLRIDESLLRYRHKFEVPEFTESRTSIAEPLQLVHYNPDEKYDPHHDFTMPGLVHLQPSRFATLLLYLNDNMEGGETAFPIWRNGVTSGPLMVKPERGKAVLFYSVLPDGNFDNLSLHEARPVRKGEKFLTNLWVWEPLLDHTTARHI
jgi:prolyl 4-hydroxylase